MASPTPSTCMQICVETLTGQTITLDVKDSDTIDNVKNRVGGMVRPSRLDAEAIRRITAGVVLGGTRLLAADNVELFGTVGAMRTSLQVGQVIQVLKKFVTDICEPEDLHMQDRLYSLAMNAVRLARSPEEHDIEAALSEVPSCARTLHFSGKRTITFNVTLVFGSPFLLSCGKLNCRGLSYSRA